MHLAWPSFSVSPETIIKALQSIFNTALLCFRTHLLQLSRNGKWMRMFWSRNNRSSQAPFLVCFVVQLRFWMFFSFFQYKQVFGFPRRCISLWRRCSKWCSSKSFAKYTSNKPYEVSRLEFSVTVYWFVTLDLNPESLQFLSWHFTPQCKINLEVSRKQKSFWFIRWFFFFYHEKLNRSATINQFEELLNNQETTVCCLPPLVSPLAAFRETWMRSLIYSCNIDELPLVTHSQKTLAFSWDFRKWQFAFQRTFNCTRKWIVSRQQDRTR